MDGGKSIPLGNTQVARSSPKMTLIAYIYETALDGQAWSSMRQPALHVRNRVNRPQYRAQTRSDLNQLILTFSSSLSDL